MNQTKKESGFEYNRLSYKGRFFRNLWMMPLSVIFLFFPDELFKFLAEASGISIISKTAVALFVALVFLLAAAYNLYMWKTKGSSHNADPADPKNRLR